MDTITEMWKKHHWGVEVNIMTTKPCYSDHTDKNRIPETNDPQDDRIKALVRFMARCAAKSDYHQLSNILEKDVEIGTSGEES